MIVHSTVDSMEILPELDISRPEELLKKNRFTLAGRLAQFYENKTDNKLNFSLTYMTNSDASLINQWWTDQTVLNVVEEFLDITSSTYFITNQEQPFSQLHRPYNDLWQGQIILEEV